MNTEIFHGCIPALMSPCDRHGQPDLPALAASGVELMEAGMTAVVYCGSMGDWPLLDDDVRQQGVEHLVRAGVPVIVGTGAQNPARARAHAAHAARAGASGLMLIPRVLSRGTSMAAQREHFRGLLGAASELPSIIYNSPHYGFETRADLFFELHREHPNLIGFKEFAGSAALDYAAEHITNASDGLLLMVGVDTQVYHGFVNCGAVGAITGIGNVAPRPVLRLVDLCRRAAQGDVRARRLALELDQALAVLSRFDEGTDLVLYYKYLMTLTGDSAYQWHFNASDALSDSQKTFAATQLALFQRWWSTWEGRLDTVDSKPVAAAL